MNDDPYSDDSNTLADAQAAFSGVSCLVEILGKCAPGEQVTGIFIRSLLVDVKMHLDNVVDALRPDAAHLPGAVAGAGLSPH